MESTSILTTPPSANLILSSEILSKASRYCWTEHVYPKERVLYDIYIYIYEHMCVYIYQNLPCSKKASHEERRGENLHDK